MYSFGGLGPQVPEEPAERVDTKATEGGRH